MKPHIHAQNSTNKYGGILEDYEPIHNFMDSSKQAYAGLAHRAILHSAFGIFLAERVFGTTITNSDGKKVSVRDIAEQHVFEDLGFIPTVQDWLEDLEIKTWMHGRAAVSKQKHRVNKLETIFNEFLKTTSNSKVEAI